MRNRFLSFAGHRPYILHKIEWLGLLTVFLFASILGHDPWWKHGETYSFGVINYFYQTGTWLVPTNSGIPFMEKPPLFYWTAAIMCRLFGRWLTLPDAARLACVFYMLITFFGIRRLSHFLFATHIEHKKLERICTWLFLGTYGLTWYGHALAIDIALLAGTTLALYGMALILMTPEQWLRGGGWLGFGFGMAFMSKGLIIPGILVLSGIALLAMLPELRTRQTVKTILWAAAVAAPFLFIWPALLYLHSPTLFMEWFWDNNIGRFFGFSVAKLGAANRPLYLLYTAPVFAFPSFPLACIETWIVLRNGAWRKKEYLFPLAVAVIGMTILLFSASGRRVYLLPLLPVFSLLAAPALLRLSSRFLIPWNKACRLIFSLLAAGTWLLWWILLYPSDTRPLAWFANLFKNSLPLDFVPSGGQPLAIAFALLAALFWGLSWRFKSDTPTHTARIWFTGVTLLWCTCFTLLMPWFDETRTYRPLFQQMMQFLIHETPYAGACIGKEKGNYHLNENIVPMFEYATEKKLVEQSFDHPACPLMLTVVVVPDAPEDISPSWWLIWRGSRPRPHDLESEEMRLYVHTPDPSSKHPPRP